jgi:hypothetical protein
MRLATYPAYEFPAINGLDPSITGSGPTLPAGHPFLNVQVNSNPYWSATTQAENPNAAWIVFFGPALVSGDVKVVAHFVWCVRGEMNSHVY